MQRKACGVIWPECSVHPLAWFRSSNCREANSQPHLQLSIVPNPDHLVSLTREPRPPQSPSYSLSWTENKRVFPSSCSQPVAHTTHPTSQLKESLQQNQTLYQVPPIQRHMPRNPKWANSKNYLYQSRPAKSGREDPLLKLHRHQCKESRITKHQENMTLSKVINKVQITDSKEIKTYELSKSSE